tara:strand:- start:674 stop:1552 length:879 start_codon:yes stop_codon:yes gene_type:complete
MSPAPELCLGTVQFGLSYGITNQAGQVNELEVRQILNLAAAAGICLLDTAQAYGTAEKVLGHCWPQGARRRLISKLPAKSPRESWEQSLITTLQRLKTQKLDGFLLHRASDLLEPDGGRLLEWLNGLRQRGLVERIGVSIYEASELENLPLRSLQIVQLPLSVYDQRLIHDGTVDRLRELGIAVHVRSVLLQGLLLQSPEHWPNHLTTAFRDHHTQWLDHLHNEGMTPLEASLGFIRAHEELEAGLVGVVSKKELSQILKAWDQAKGTVLQATDNWAWDNALDIDPRCWPPR